MRGTLRAVGLNELLGGASHRLAYYYWKDLFRNMIRILIVPKYRMSQNVFD
jgi:hypothetical protein